MTSNWLSPGLLASGEGGLTVELCADFRLGGGQAPCTSRVNCIHICEYVYMMYVSRYTQYVYAVSDVILRMCLKYTNNQVI